MRGPRQDSFYATSLNFVFGTPQTGHLSGASATAVCTQKPQTKIEAGERSWSAFKVSNALEYNSKCVFSTALALRKETTAARLPSFSAISWRDENKVGFNRVDLEKLAAWLWERAG